MDNTVTFDAEKAEQFRDLYIDALKSGKDSFTYEGNAVLTDYAKYICEHLANCGVLKTH